MHQPTVTALWHVGYILYQCMLWVPLVKLLAFSHIKPGENVVTNVLFVEAGA